MSPKTCENIEHALFRFIAVEASSTARSAWPSLRQDSALLGADKGIFTNSQPCLKWHLARVMRQSGNTATQGVTAFSASAQS